MERKNFITIELSDEVQNTEYLVLGEVNNNYHLLIKTNPNNTYEQIRSNKQEMMRQLKSISDWCKGIGSDLFEGSAAFNNKVISEEIVLFEDVDSIYIDGSVEDSKTFIYSSPELQNYKIVLRGINELDSENLKKASQYFDGYSNVYCYSDRDGEIKTLEGLIKRNDKIDSIVDKVKLYDYSPFEQLLHAYDIINELKENNDIEELFVDNYKFSSLVEAVVTKLGIPVRRVELSYKDGYRNYCLNAVYIMDDKYNIDGIYYIGLPEGKRKFKSQPYAFFMRTKSEFEQYTDNQFIDETFSSITKKLILETLKGSEYDLTNMSKKDKKTFLTIAHLVGNNDFVYYLTTQEQPEIMKRVEKYINLFSRHINIATFLKALINVRKNQYYENSEKYEFGEDKLFETAINSGFRSNNYLEESVVAKILKLENPDMIKSKMEELNEQFVENGVARQVEQVKLAKTLRKALESKTNK